MSIHISIVNLQSASCQAGTCDRLADQITDSFGEKETTICASTSLMLSEDCPAPDLILLRAFSSSAILEFTQSLKRKDVSVHVLALFCGWRPDPIVVSTALDHDLADFITCPFEEIDLIPRIRRLVGKSVSPPPIMGKERQQAKWLCGTLVGESPCFIHTVEKASRLARSDATALICGETGTGKDLFARAIHYQSERNGQPYVPVNCAAIPDHLCENELFGHVKGAFTDASCGEKGLIAEAEGGTLFLDEVGAMPMPLQAKVLRFLQNREYRPLGSSKSMVADLRVLAATNIDLKQQVESGRFREDLYYRLNVLHLSIPPLRERVEDVPLLARLFLNQYSKRHGLTDLAFSTEALQKLVFYSWPGNVRELEAVIQQAVILASSPVIHEQDICLMSSSQTMPPLRRAKNETVRQFERAFLVNLMQIHKGNVTHAARAAGKERRSLQRLLRKYGIDREVFSHLT